MRRKDNLILRTVAILVMTISYINLNAQAILGASGKWTGKEMKE